MNNNPHYNDITVNEDALQLLPDNGIPTDIMSVETEDDIVLEDDSPAAAGSPTDNRSEDVVYDNSTEMSSFLPVGEQQQQELEAVRNQLLKVNQCHGLQLKMILLMNIRYHI
jgi:hypothetical protein